MRMERELQEVFGAHEFGRDADVVTSLLKTLFPRRECPFQTSSPRASLWILMDSHELMKPPPNTAGHE